MRLDRRVFCLGLAAAPLAAACVPGPDWRGLVKIGLVLPFHGPSPSAAMDLHVAVRQRLIDRDRSGGLAGWRLELVSLDDENDPAVADQRMRELTIDPDVVAALAARTTPAMTVRPPTLEALDGLLVDVSAGLAAGATPRAGLRARLLGT